MAFSQAVIRELQGELARLQRDREKLEQHMNSLQAVLAGITNGTNGHDVQRPNTVVSDRVRNPVSLRATILEILRGVPAGANTSEIAELLVQRQFQIGGSTSLRERITHELRRLRLSGIVRKSRNKKFRLLPTSSPSTTSTTEQSESLQ
jgi:hypothetical protein